MTKRKGLIQPTPTEDAAINAGIAVDPDTYEITDFKKMRPASEVLPGLIGKPAADRLLKKRGRPAGSGSKVQLSVRFDEDVVNAFRESGDGWQTRMNNVLRDWLKTHDIAKSPR